MSLRVSGGRRLRSPKGDVARPTSGRVRLAVINLLAPQLHGARWLDLCCGSGAMACEALQRGVREVVAVERDRRIAAVARANLEAVRGGLRGTGPLTSGEAGGPDQSAAGVEVVCDEVLRWLNRGLGDGFDLIYADPPYAAGLYAPIATAVRRGGWLRPKGILVWECGSDAVPEPPEGWRRRDQRRYGGTTVVLLQAAAEP